jgi:Uma2 family endonuclease
MLTRQDLEHLQAQNPDYRMELVNGQVMVMSPSGYESDEVAVRFTVQLWNWVDPRKLGRVTGSSAGFDLPELGIRAPDASFVSAERLRRAPRSFARLVPDMMVEVKSPTDSIEALEAKIARFLELGAKVGILINPEAETVRLYRLNQPVESLTSTDLLTVPELLPDWEVRVADLWSPVFE